TDIPVPNLYYYDEGTLVEVKRWAQIENELSGEMERVEVTDFVLNNEKIGQVGSYAANMTCPDAAVEVDASYLECDSVMVFDTIWKPTYTIVSVEDELSGEINRVCQEDGYEIDRIDSGYTYTCIKRCTPAGDTLWFNNDTIIRWTEDSITVTRDTFYDLGTGMPQKLCPPLDSMHIVMEVWTSTDCYVTDTFTLKRLDVMRTFPTDTSVSHGDTIRLFATANPDATQWWGGDKALAYDAFTPGTTPPRILDVNAKGFDPNTRFVGDTAPVRLSDQFRGDTVDMVLYTEQPFVEYNRTCVVKDTVPVAVVSGYQIAGYVSYDSFWMPSAPNDILLHRPIANVTVYLHRASDGEIIDSAMSASDGYFTFYQRFPAGKYYTTGVSLQKTIYLSGYGLAAVDATLIQAWVTGTLPKPYIMINGTSEDLMKKTMIFVASNPNEVEGVVSGKSGNWYNLVAGSATTVQGRVTGILGEYTHNTLNSKTLDWKYSIDTFDVYEDVLDDHIYGVMVGDVDISYVPEPYIQGGVVGALTGTGMDYLQDKEYGVGGSVADLFTRPSWADPSSGGSMSSRRRASSRRAPEYVAPTHNFDSMDTLYVNGEDQFVSMPIFSRNTSIITSAQLFITVPSSDVEVLSVQTALVGGNLVYNIIGDQVRITWVPNGGKPTIVQKGDVMFNLVLKVNRSKRIKNLPVEFVLETYNSGVSDIRYKPDMAFKFALPVIVIDNNLPITILDSILEEEVLVTDTMTSGSEEIAVVPTGQVNESKIITVIPNPMVERADVTYSVAHDESVVTIKLFNLLGVEVSTVVASERQNAGIFRSRLSAETIPSGVYVLRMETISKDQKETSIEKVVVTK
ncbi:MAG: T9SS type A sorting domain-containing protein, partial [Bacteroidales bacterium]|nr:T9SS type A sorting domain-containing protein [Bacteroidales bacterium]